jgi:hypothetical protein
MRQPKISIAAASLAALLVGVGPAAAGHHMSSDQTTGGTASTSSDSSVRTPDTRGNDTDRGASTETNEDRGSVSTDCAASSTPGASAQSSVSADTAKGTSELDCQSPSASPPMSDDQQNSGRTDEKQQIREEKQIDRNSNQDRG